VKTHVVARGGGEGAATLRHSGGQGCRIDCRVAQATLMRGGERGSFVLLARGAKTVKYFLENMSRPIDLKNKMESCN